MFSSSASMTSRICTKLPSRSPELLAVATRSGFTAAAFLPVIAAGAVLELGIRVTAASAVGVDLVGLPAVERADVLLAELPVDQELDALHGVEAVVLRRERLIVGRVHVLDHRPRGPSGGESALGGAGGEQLPREGLHLLPRLRRLLRIQPRLLEGVLVVVEDRRRR